jgi:hypothetical protein
MRINDAERSSGLDLRSFGMARARSWVNRGIELGLSDDGRNPVVILVMIRDPQIPTTAGLRVGDPIGRIEEIYGAQATLIGDLEVGQGTDYLIDPAADPEYQYAVWTSDGKVRLIVAGRRGETASTNTARSDHRLPAPAVRGP